MTTMIVGAVIRHLISIIATAMATQGIINGDEIEGTVSALVAIAMGIWSIIQKRNLAKKVR